MFGGGGSLLVNQRQTVRASVLLLVFFPPEGSPEVLDGQPQVVDKSVFQSPYTHSISHEYLSSQPSGNW